MEKFKSILYSLIEIIRELFTFREDELWLISLFKIITIILLADTVFITYIYFTNV